MSSQNGKIIRPLLWATKAEIREFAKNKEIDFREDASNSENNYSRNQLRNEVLPALEKIKSGASRHIAEAIDHFAELQPVIENHLTELAGNLVESKDGKDYLDLEKWKLIREKNALLKFLGDSWGLEPVKIDQVKDLVESQPGKFVETVRGRIFRERKHLVFVPTTETAQATIEILPGQKSISSPIRLEFSEVDLTVDYKIAPAEKAFFDFEKLTFPLTLRPWREGDRFQPLGMQGKQKVSDFLIQQKVPVFEKDRVMVIESAGEIAWIVGMRVAHPFRITDSTKSIFRVEVKED
jgi:tRNA(Ile)-lysidine synthase